jgi:DNA-nicking Smr family endonuclease
MPVSRRSRYVTPEELSLWHHMVRDTAPLHGPPAMAADAEPAPIAPPAPPQAAVSAAPHAPAATPGRMGSRRLDPAGPVDLDRRSWLKLRRGNYPIDARLDLHGLTQAEAYERLVGFLAGAHARGNRCVLVITGRGLRHGGTLREMTPRWLDAEPNRSRVLSIAQAQLKHGGEGALYVLLRRGELGTGRHPS